MMSDGTFKRGVEYIGYVCVSAAEDEVHSRV